MWTISIKHFPISNSFKGSAFIGLCIWLRLFFSVKNILKLCQHPLRQSIQGNVIYMQQRGVGQICDSGLLHHWKIIGGSARKVQEKFPLAWEFSSVIGNVWLLLTLLSYNVGAALCLRSATEGSRLLWTAQGTLGSVPGNRRQSMSLVSWQLCSYTPSTPSVPSALRWVGVLPLC